MERKEVIVSEQELARQKEFTRKMREMNDRRTRTPLALVDTFGCQQNVADGEVLMGMLREMGYELTRDENQADVILLNTCAIREHAEKRVYGHLGRLSHTKAAKPDQIICLCGCMAQQKVVADKVKNSYHHVDLVLGPQAEWRLPELLHEVYTKNKRVFSIENEHGRIAEDLPIVREGGVRAWVSIMYGCNNFCSYCIVPYVRGREKSRIPGDYWLRFMSSQPKDATNKLFDTMARCEHVAKQLHLPVQSGCDRVLKAMNRPYTRAKYEEMIAYARSVMPSMVLTSDVIIGFPGETEDEAMQTVDLVEKTQFDALFTFIFSPRPGTPAAKMPDPVSREEKQVWFEKLVDAQNAISAKKHAAYIGRTVKVLVDGESDDPEFPLAARTEGNRLVRMKGDKALIGTFAKAKITDSNTWALYGEAVEE